MQLRPSYECRRPIKMSPLCQLQITLAVAIRIVASVVQDCPNTVDYDQHAVELDLGNHRSVLGRAPSRRGWLENIRCTNRNSGLLRMSRTPIARGLPGAKTKGPVARGRRFRSTLITAIYPGSPRL